jgi:hypothetical protein
VPAAKDSTLGGGKPRFNVNFSNNPNFPNSKNKKVWNGHTLIQRGFFHGK